MNIALILAGGSGNRMGLDIPKQFYSIRGKPVLIYTLEGFQQYAYERGVFSRPFLSYMYSMVPYVIEEDELVQIFTVMKDWFRRG